jgi:hypothetical protein
MHKSIPTAFWTIIFAAGVLPAAEPAPYGSKDFHPSAERPVGFRGDGAGHFPGATPPASFSGKEGKNVLWSIKWQVALLRVGSYVSH